MVFNAMAMKTVDVFIYNDCSRNGLKTTISSSSSSTSLRGFAAVPSSAGRTSCEYVQLWAGGPRWATFNVGATIADYGNLQSGTDPTSGSVDKYNTANVGGLYPWKNPNLNGRKTTWNRLVSTGKNDVANSLWGSNWRTPTMAELNALNTKTKWQWCNGTTTQFVPGCTVKGYKVSGKDAYANNSIFLPAAGLYGAGVGNSGVYGFYWSNTLSGGQLNAYSLWFISSAHAIDNETDQQLGFSVRAVLADGATTTPNVSYAVVLKAEGCSTTNFYQVEAGTMLNMTAVAISPCNRFVRWSDGNTSNPRTVTVTGDATYTAIFEKVQYTITTAPDNAAHGETEAVEKQ